MAARRVAEELNEEVGGRVGYQMRFEEVVGPRTRIRFMTEGTLTRRLLRDPELRGVAAVLLDEFHERHLEGDIALALLRKLQLARRPDLRLVVMSATLDAAPVSSFLCAPRLRCEGTLFDVTVEYLPRRDPRPQESLVAQSVTRLVDEGLDGHVLVFLPGMLEIRRAMEACGSIARRAGIELHRLHGSLPAAEQDRAIQPSDRRKVILSTNVAETSVTINGVACVVDTGLARTAIHAPWSGFSTLAVTKISQASAKQRAGRAGRTRSGRCLRLYTKGDLAARPSHDTPEVARSDLSQAALELFAAGVTRLDSLQWLDAPPASGVGAANELLSRLGATHQGPTGTRLSAIGERMLRFPVHPRLARIVVEAERRGCPEDGAAIAAILGERDAFGPPPHRREHGHSSDVLAALDVYQEASASNFATFALQRLGVDSSRALAVSRVHSQLLRLVDRQGRRGPAPACEDALPVIILAGYPDRVGRLRRPANATGRARREVVLASGGTAILAESSCVADVDLVVVVDAEERVDASTGGSPKLIARLASAIEVDHLIELFTDHIRDTTEAVWNESAERVDVVRRLSYDALVLDETRRIAGSSDQVGRIVAEAAKKKGWREFVRGDGLDEWLARVAFVRRVAPELDVPEVDEAIIEATLARLCDGISTLAELRARNLAASLQRLLPPKVARELEDLAPRAITLPGGRRLTVDYTTPPPSISSRIQDFFGMASGPAIAKGRVPLVIHLLAPNQRDVQVTTDLGRFWGNHYPALANELRRRYPKHSWPDDPLAAAPAEPRRRPP
jgi:ATP-dependent helicase HrpB